MSPSEADLRAALGRGEDDGGELDVDRIVQQGQLHVARRRVRLLSAAAVTAVVGVGLGAYALRGGDGSARNDAARNVPSMATAANGQAAGLAPHRAERLPAAGPAASSAAGANTVPPSCPPSRPQPLSPAGNGASGATRLFPGPVRSVLICSYGPPGGTGTTASSLTLTGRDATALVTSLENASRKNLVTPCPSGAGARQRVLALIGVQPDGARLPAVTMILSDPACNVSVTNGQTTRYDWTPDPALVARIFALAPKPSPRMTGRIHGSPLH